MTTRYRVEYALKTHRRDQLIEWIKGLLAVPFVLSSQPTAAYDVGDKHQLLAASAGRARQKYAEVMRDVETLIQDHINNQNKHSREPSKLKILVPSIGIFFTPLQLEKAFHYQDDLRRISSRRFVAPSFNDIRLILNSAQVLSLVHEGPLRLVSFDGDLTLYNDGEALIASNPIIPRIVNLLQQGIKVAIVTAAGYTEDSQYHTRFHGLLDEIAIHVNSSTMPRDAMLVIMGGESNYLLALDVENRNRLKKVPRDDWILDEMQSWTTSAVKLVLDCAEQVLNECVKTLNLHANVVRKERAVGIMPSTNAGARGFTREQLEETVLVTQQKLELTDPVVPFCVFNGMVPPSVYGGGNKLTTSALGGNDVFVDIGDKYYGVRACQKYLGGIEGSQTLHIGDQFLSAGANDFKARLACTTAWIANPTETAQLLDELQYHLHDKHSKLSG